MNPCANSLSITDECRNCGQHLPPHVAAESKECPVCHSGEIVELELVDSQWQFNALNKPPHSKEYTVVFRMEPGTSRRAFMKRLTDTFVDHEVEILEIQAGNKLSGPEEQ
ncbi:hypothetical protein [Pseudomonas coronafaciens]|uniref:hypothetical protein n=1 Tax=Pseudomonas coronafaciens TaxID=53409 RepID=UPI000E3B9ED6|nr:hypothetical protein [Pseudomonas coronafaciens]